MSFPNISTADELNYERSLSAGYHESLQANASAVSWSAVMAGAAAIAALSLILLMLGTGLGLSSVSPWAYNGVSAATFGVTSILWLTFTQLLASGMGGYLAGRLRIKWLSAHTDEVHFRDTAHGFLAWAVAALTTAALLTSVIGSIVSGGVQAGASVAGGVTTSAGGVALAKAVGDNEPMGYFVDLLFRKDINTATITLAPSEGYVLPEATQEPIVAEPGREVARIFMNTIHTAPLPAEDIRHVGQLVALRTGLSQQDAEKRVIDTYARVQAKLYETESAAKQAIDKTRKASAYAALWLFISLLIGAFAASFAATFGGRQRDM